MRWAAPRLALLLIALAALGAGLPPRSTPVRPPNVLLVTIDTVRADHLGAYGDAKASTPVLDQLARDGVRFADATSQAPLTGPAHAAILTGRYPARFGLRDNATTPLPADVTTLADAFKAHGYRTGGFVGAFILDSQYGFGHGFDTFDDRFAHFSTGQKLNVRRPGGEVVDAAVAWLAKPSTRAFFAWVHLYDAHAPYEAPPAFRAKFPTAPYDGAISYVDACVGRLVARLRQDGRLDRTVVTVIADHGESLGEHGEQEHGVFLYDSTLHVPWIVRLPGRARAGTVVTTEVREIDVLPTLEALAGLPLTTGLDGESVLPEIEGHPRRDPPPSYAETWYPKLHFGLSELKSVRVDGWKYIDAPRPELYEVSRDPQETLNRIDTRGQLASGLSAEVQRIQSTFGGHETASARQPDPETIARLKALGYVGVVARATGGRGEDPKDAIGRLERLGDGLMQAQALLSRGQSGAAIAGLEDLRKDNDGSYELHLTLGDAYLGARRYQDAAGEYSAAAALNPEAAAPLVAASRAYLDLGDPARAEEALDRAERLEPGSSEIRLARGIIDEQQGRRAEALREYRAALDANPSDASARARVAGMALEVGELDLAAQQFRILLRLGYRPSRMHFGLGQVAQARGDRARAATEYREALRLEPAFAAAKAALEAIQRQPGS